MKIKNLVEYDGYWHKKDKDGNCEPFTMKDLEELLNQARQKIIEEIEKLLPEQKKWKITDEYKFEDFRKVDFGGGWNGCLERINNLLKTIKQDERNLQTKTEKRETA
jgi:hypothetical protein